MRLLVPTAGFLLTALALVCLSPAPALALAPEVDLLQVKNYSPQTIRIIEMQRSRQEWKEPASPLRTPAQAFWHNVWYGDWTGSLDDFGSGLIREGE